MTHAVRRLRVVLDYESQGQEFSLKGLRTIREVKGVYSQT